MATIQSVLEFQDKMSITLNKIVKALENASASSTVAQTSLNMLENEQSQWKQTLDLANNSIIKNTEAIKQAQEKYDEVTKSIEKTNAELNEYKQIINQNQEKIDKIAQEQQNFNNALNNTNNAANKAGDGLNSMQGKIITLSAAFQLFNQAKAFIQGINSKINEFVIYTQIQMQAEDQLSIITKQRMGLMDSEVRSLYDLAAAQQRVGVVGDEAVITGMAGIAAFTRQKSSIEALTPAMNNLAVKMYGYNVTASSMDAISKALGRALLGDVGALSRMGIKIDENQKKWLMSLNEQQRAIELSKIITDVTGDMNEEMAKTPFGEMQQATNSLGDSYERLGAILLPLQANIMKGWSDIMNALVSNLDTVVPLAIAALTALAGAYTVLKAKAIASAIASAAAWISATAPFWIVIGVIGLAIALIDKLGISFQQQAKNMLISINWLISAVKNLISYYMNLEIAIYNAFHKNKMEYRKIEANDYYTNQAKAEQQLNKMSGAMNKGRDLLGKATSTSGTGIDSSLITSTAGGKALKTQQQGEIEINGEDLQLLHDMATRDYMINYQQQNLTPQVNLPNVVIHETADVDSVVESLVSAVTDLAQSKLVRA